MWTKSERKGTGDQAKGRLKQAAGALTGREDLQAEGLVDETRGKVESAVGRVRRKSGNAIARAGKALKS